MPTSTRSFRAQRHTAPFANAVLASIGGAVVAIHATSTPNLSASRAPLADFARASQYLDAGETELTLIRTAIQNGRLSAASHLLTEVHTANSQFGEPNDRWRLAYLDLIDSVATLDRESGLEGRRRERTTEATLALLAPHYAAMSNHAPSATTTSLAVPHTSVTLPIVTAVDFPREQLSKTYQNLADAEARLEDSPIQSNRIFAAAWNLLHAEWLAGGSVRRFEQSAKHFARGFDLLHQVEAEVDEDELSKPENLAVALHLDTIRLRQAEIAETQRQVNVKLIEELRLLREVNQKYRAIASDMALVHRDMGLQVWESALHRLDDVDKAFAGADSVAQEWAQAGLEPAFLNQAEAEDRTGNPAVIPPFSEGTDAMLKSMAATSRLRLAVEAEEPDRTRLLTEAKLAAAAPQLAGDPLAAMVRAEAAERLAEQMLEGNQLFSAQARRSAEELFREARQAWQAAREGIEKEKTAARNPRQLDASQVASTQSEIAIAAILAPMPATALDQVLQRVDSRLKALSDPAGAISDAQVHQREKRVPQAVNVLRSTLGRHSAPNVWYEYFAAQRRQDGAAALGLFLNAKAEGALQRGTFESDFTEGSLLVAHVLSEMDAGKINPLAVGANPEGVNQIAAARGQLTEELTSSIVAFTSARIVAAASPERVAQCEAWQGFALALAYLLNPEPNFTLGNLTREQVRVLAERTISALEASVNDPMAPIATKEAAFMALQARALAEVIQPASARSPRIAQLAFASAMNAWSELPYGPTSAKAAGSLGLEHALTVSGSDNLQGIIAEEQSLRVALQSFVDSSIAYQFGHPSDGNRTLERGLDELRNDAGADTGNAPPVRLVNAFQLLLRETELDTSTVVAALNSYGILGPLSEQARREDSDLRVLDEAAVNTMLTHGLQAVQSVETNLAVTPSAYSSIIPRIGNPFAATALALAVDAKLAALGLDPHPDRVAWRNAAVALIERARELAEPQTTEKYPFFVSLQDELMARISSPAALLAKAEQAVDEGRLAAAVTLLDDAARRHADVRNPDTSDGDTIPHLWRRYFDVSLRIARLAAASNPNDASAFAPPQQVLEHWRRNRPDTDHHWHAAHATLLLETGNFEAAAVEFQAAESKASPVNHALARQYSSLRAEAMLRRLQTADPVSPMNAR